jgi:predicted transcriptional regulator
VLNTDNVFGILSDRGTLEIFNFIANNRYVRSQALRDTFGFSVKQYYSRMQRLLVSGIIRRKVGVYSLSAFGTVVYRNKMIMDAAIKEYNSLKALDSLIGSNELPSDIMEKIISNIVTNNDIKMALLNKVS